jgi:hypothetical protein
VPRSHNGRRRPCRDTWGKAVGRRCERPVEVRHRRSDPLALAGCPLTCHCQRRARLTTIRVCSAQPAVVHMAAAEPVTCREDAHRRSSEDPSRRPAVVTSDPPRGTVKLPVGRVTAEARWTDEHRQTAAEGMSMTSSGGRAARAGHGCVTRRRAALRSADDEHQLEAHVPTAGGRAEVRVVRRTQRCRGSLIRAVAAAPTSTGSRRCLQIRRLAVRRADAVRRPGPRPRRRSVADRLMPRWAADRTAGCCWTRP